MPTPALVIDLDVLERNLATRAGLAARAGCALRPHVKSHKCPQIAQRQWAAGAIGVSCATLEEVAAMVACATPGILLTSPLAGEPKLRALAALLARDPAIRVVLDDPAAVAELDPLARGLSMRLAVLVDFDAGQQRTGARGVLEAVALASAFRGLPPWSSTACRPMPVICSTSSPGRPAKRALRASQEQVRALCEALRREQLAPRIVTGAGTGSVELDGPGGVYTKLQPGSYVFMDAEYFGRVEACWPITPRG